MHEEIFYREIQREIENLVKVVGQERYYEEILPRILHAYREVDGLGADSVKYRKINETLWLAGWYVSDYSDHELRRTYPGVALSQ